MGFRQATSHTAPHHSHRSSRPLKFSRPSCLTTGIVMDLVCPLKQLLCARHAVVRTTVPMGVTRVLSTTVTGRVIGERLDECSVQVHDVAASWRFRLLCETLRRHRSLLYCVMHLSPVHRDASGFTENSSVRCDGRSGRRPPDSRAALKLEAYHPRRQPHSFSLFPLILGILDRVVCLLPCMPTR